MPRALAASFSSLCLSRWDVILRVAGQIVVGLIMEIIGCAFVMARGMLVYRYILKSSQSFCGGKLGGTRELE